MKITNDSFALHGASARLDAHNTSFGDYWTGVVMTPLGYVEVYAQKDRDPDNTYTALRFCCGGRLYIRKIYRLFTERGISIVAERFAKEYSE